jgi:hypothetical protein
MRNHVLVVEHAMVFVAAGQAPFGVQPELFQKGQILGVGRVGKVGVGLWVDHIGGANPVLDAVPVLALGNPTGFALAFEQDHVAVA